MILARDLASEAITDPGKPIPLLVSAASWRGGAAVEGGLASWLASEVPVLADSMADLIQSQKVILLVDGLDELSAKTLRSGPVEEKQPRRDLIKVLPQSGSLVLASRPREFQEAIADLNISAVFELKPLTDGQVAAFVAEVPGTNQATARRPDARGEHVRQFNRGGRPLGDQTNPLNRRQPRLMQSLSICVPQPRDAK